MSAIPTATTKQGVTLLRLGQGKEEVELPEGATLADLLQKIGADPTGLEILVDGKPIEAWLVLQTGMIVSIGNRPNQAATNGARVGGIGDFHDDPVFEAMMDQVNVEREREKQAT